MLTQYTIQSTHQFIGTWITRDEDSDSAIKIESNHGMLEVSAFCRSDGEFFDVKAVVYDGDSIEIEMVMPSTNWKSISKMVLREDGDVDFELTTYDIWKKKSIIPGELPEAWQGKDLSTV